MLGVFQAFSVVVLLLSFPRVAQTFAHVSDFHLSRALALSAPSLPSFPCSLSISTFPTTRRDNTSYFRVPLWSPFSSGFFSSACWSHPAHPPPPFLFLSTTTTHHPTLQGDYSGAFYSTRVNKHYRPQQDLSLLAFLVVQLCTTPRPVSSSSFSPQLAPSLLLRTHELCSR